MRRFQYVRRRVGLTVAAAVLASAAALQAGTAVRGDAARASLAVLAVEDAAGRDDARDRLAAALAGEGYSATLADFAAQAALLEPEPAYDTALTLTRQALAGAPARADAWARLAYVDAVSRADGRVTRDGAQALAHAYAASPFGNEASQRWRLRFALSQWDSLDAETKASAQANAAQLALSRSGRAFLEQEQAVAGISSDAAAMLAWELYATD